MIRRFSINFAIYSFLLDAILVSLSLALANGIRPALNAFPFIQDLPEPVLPILLFPIFSALWTIILLFFAVYDGRKNVSFVNELLNLTMGSLLAGVASAGVLYLSFRDISRILFITFFLTSFMALVGWRVIAHIWASRRQDGKSRQPVLVIGSGEAARDIALKIAQNAAGGLALTGYLAPVSAEGFPASWLGNLDGFKRVVGENGIEHVVIALPNSEHGEVARIILELHQLPVKVWVIPDYFQLALFRAGMDEFAGVPMLDLRASAISEYQRVLKRILDLAITLAVLIPAIPLMALIALAILIDSGRPVLFRQKRVGENGRPFSVNKFRSMVRDAEELEREENEGNGTHKSADDPRVTRIGRILRRTSLDELPQFFNVLLGNMSLVGPRPELPKIVETYEPWQHQRFAVPPGMTGWWQITGRSEKMLHLHTEDDIYYIKNYSFMLDLQILLKTIGAVIRGTGAF